MRFYLRLVVLLALLNAWTAWAAPAEEGAPALSSDAPPPPGLDDPIPANAGKPAPPQPTQPPSPKATNAAPVPATGVDGNVEPEITIVERTSATFEEYRSHGRLYKIKVIPKVGPPYYLIDEDGNGVWHRYDSWDQGLKVPRWVILRF